MQSTFRKDNIKSELNREILEEERVTIQNLAGFVNKDYRNITMYDIMGTVDS